MNVLCLTEDQLDEVLIAGSVADADLPRAAAMHLSACALCQERLSAAGAPLAGFRDMSLAWAERRSATLPLRPAGFPAGRSRHARRLAWATVATAVLAVGIALPMAHERAVATPVSDAPQSVAAVGHTGMSSVTPAAATPDQIDQDNQMLQEIDRALDAPTDSPADYGLLTTSAPSRAQVRSGAVRD